ncbi:meiotic nuclear division protein 1 [Pelomyxa schiedti]|nr:meiotic nuclear division protein 1 [Pelomyxa schiedti]
MSKEEKRNKLHEWFLDNVRVEFSFFFLLAVGVLSVTSRNVTFPKGGVYTLKEVIASSKATGIVANTIEETLNSLVDDSLVSTEKIGSSKYFWAFKKDAAVKKRVALESAQKRVAELTEKLERLTTENAQLHTTHACTEETKAAVAQLDELRAKHDSLSTELESMADNDPVTIQQTDAKATKLKEAADRWTDNIFTLKKFCADKWSMDPADIDRQFSLPTDLDYIEEPADAEPKGKKSS